MTTPDAMATLFQALGDPTRLRILGLLLGGEVCVCHIHESLRIPQPRASRHLAYLRRSGLVASRRDGLWVHYRLAESPEPVLAAVREAVCSALGALDVVRRDADRLQKKTTCAPMTRTRPIAAATALRLRRRPASKTRSRSVNPAAASSKRR